MPTLHAVTECFGLAAGETWVDIPERRPPYIRLWSRTEPEEVALLVALLCTYNSPPDKRHGASLDELLALHDVVAPGGLAAVGGEVFIPPSCCCGLESWREWLRFVDCGEQPWLGHNPSPWVETTGSGYVVWSDGGLGDAPSGELRSVEFTRHELQQAITAAAADLEGFLEPLASWAQKVAPHASSSLVERFCSWFEVRGVA